MRRDRIGPAAEMYSRRREKQIIALAWFGALALGLAASGDTAWAEPPSTSYIFPAGGQRGTQVAVRVGGHYLHDRAAIQWIGAGVTGPAEVTRSETLWFEGPLVRLPASQRQEDYPKDYSATLSIAVDAEPGARYWRVWNAQGATSARKFIVGDLPEVVEEELDGEPIPVEVKLPVTVNGRMFPREDVDIWTFEAEAGASLTVAVAAASLGSPLEARVELLGPDGQKLADATAPAGRDPIIHAIAPARGRYQVRVQDARFEGLQNYVYRATMISAPWVDSAYPLGGRRGEELEVEPLGSGIPVGAVRIKLPAEPANIVTRSLPLASGASNPVVFALSDRTELREQEPNDQLETARSMLIGAAANGRIDRPGDVDQWVVELAQGAALDLEVVAARLGSPLDAQLIVRDATGKELARADDGPGGSPDAQLKFTAPAAGKYGVEVRERFAGRGGRAFAYRLLCGQGPPDVRLELAAEVLSVERGGTQKLAVVVQREGGFAAPVTLTAVGLPQGVTAPEVVVAANQNRGELVFKADGQLKPSAVPLRIVGRFERDGVMVEAIARVPGRLGEPALDQLLLAVTLPTPFKFQGAYELVYIPCGAVSRKRYAIERNGYVGPLVVQLADKQNRHLQGVTGPVITVPADANEFVYPITLPPWMELGRTSRVVLMATGEVDDGQGGKHKVCFTSGDQNNQMVNLVSPSPLRVTLDRTSVAAPVEGTLPIRVTLRRDPSIQSAARVELVTPRHWRGVAADPVEIPAGQNEGTLTLRFARDAGPLNMPATIRATAVRNADPLVAEASLELVRP